MNERLVASELFEDMEERDIAQLVGLAQRRALKAGEYLFLLGENADRLYIVLGGKLEVCFPLSFAGTLKDVAVESKPPGSALGWSALVKPYRFTLSARAAEPSEVASFHRQELMQVLDADCHVGHAFTRRVAEMIGRRFLTIQALWARELQRAVAAGMVGLQGAPPPPP